MPYLKINQLNLFDFRCFHELSIDFDPKLTVLVAGNGAGKTSVLDAIAVALGPFVGAFDEAAGLGFGSSDIRQFPTRKTKSIDMEYAPGGVMLEAFGHIPNLDGESGLGAPVLTRWSRSLTGPIKAKTTVRESKQLVEYAKRLQQLVRTPNSEILLPLVAYYGTGRLWQQKNLTTSRRLPRRSRTVGYADSLDSASNYKSFVAWFRYWTESALEAWYKEGEQTEQIQFQEFKHYLESVSRAVNLCLKHVGWSDIRYSIAAKALVASHKEHGELPVEILSDGIRNMIGMVADIAFRATKLNPDLGSSASEKVTGIVLIDEVEMHLHPSWQQTVLASLRQAFPYVQFIVTTHSPQVLTSVPADCIRLLQSEMSVETGAPHSSAQKFYVQTQGVASSTILAEVMDTDPTPNIEPAQWLSLYNALIQQSAHESREGIALKAKLVAHFGEDHPLIAECERLIRLQAYRATLRAKKSSQSMDGEI